LHLTAAQVCVDGTGCPATQYCECNDLFGVVDCVNLPSRCSDLPLGASSLTDGPGYATCTKGSDCPAGYYCKCFYDEDNEAYDCNFQLYESYCQLLSAANEYNPTADQDGPGFFECLQGDDCGPGKWCSCLQADDGSWACDTAGGTECVALEEDMTAVADAPGYFRCTNGLHCDPGQFCNCQASLDSAACYEQADGHSDCQDLKVGFVAFLTHPHDYACNNGTYSDAVPGVSGGHSGCLQCESGRFSQNDGEGKGSCDAARRGYYVDDDSVRNQELPCSPGAFAGEEASSACEACRPGEYTSAVAAHFCNCSEAGHVPTADRSNTVPCAPGTFAQGECNANCTDCADGHYADQEVKFKEQASLLVAVKWPSAALQPLLLLLWCVRALPVGAGVGHCGR
jgi:hypothetical protein